MKLFYTNKQCEKDMEITRKWLGFISPDWHLDLDGAYEEIEDDWDFYVKGDIERLSEGSKAMRQKLIEFREKIIDLK